MEWSCPWELATPGGTISFNVGSGDDFVLDPDQCSGDMPEVRATVDPAPRDDGGIVHAGYLGHWPIVLAGVMHNTTGTAAARNAMEDDLVTALRSIVATTGTLEQTPSGGSARSISVQLQVRLATSSWGQVQGAWVKQFVFGLVSGDTDWS
jgi:hypothetical protein